MRFIDTGFIPTLSVLENEHTWTIISTTQAKSGISSKTLFLNLLGRQLFLKT